MLTYALRRLLIAIPVFFGITIMTWIIATTNPNGGALVSFLGKGGGKSLTTKQIDAIKTRLGLNQPLPVRYIYWVRNLFRGNLGNSLFTHQSVVESIQERMLPTVLLLGVAFLFQELLGLPLGIFAAIRRGTFFDQIFTIVVYILYALPTFWFGLMAIILIGLDLHGFLLSTFGVNLFPFDGISNVSAGGPFGTHEYWNYFHAHTVQAVLDVANHMILPVTVLATVGMAGDSRFMRASMLDVLSQDYIRTAKAKGLAPRVTTFKHALRNALLPIVTNIGLSLPGLLSGAIVTETIFSWPGMGRLYINAAQNLDYPVVIAYVVMLGGLTLIFNILTDLSYALVDPRIRYS